MKNALHLISKIAHVAANLLQKHWFFALLLFIITLMFVIWVFQWLAHMAAASVAARQEANKRKAPPEPEGRRGEVLKSLKRLSPEHYSVFSDLYLPRLMNNGLTHLDFVVLSRQGIFVIQVEDIDGEIFGNAEEKNWLHLRGTKSKHVQNPLWRNVYHVKALAHFLRQPDALFHSVIYYPGEVSFKMPPPDNVLTEGLGSYISSQPIEPLLTEELFQRINVILQTASRKMKRDALEREYLKTKRRRASHKSKEY